MHLTSLCLATLLRRHPWAEEVLEWHGIDVHEVDQTLTLHALCWLRRLDEHQLARDLEAARLMLETTEPLAV